MIYNDFRGKKLSALGFGMMRLPVAEGKDGEIDETEVQKLVDCAMENGVNYYDTAWGYHGGMSEIVTARCLSKYPRDSYCLATKFPGYDTSNMDKVVEIFAKQLEKCKVDYFDFYLFHSLSEGNIEYYLDPKYGIMDHLLKQKREGRIKHLGFSAHASLETMQRFLDAYGEYMEFCQIQLNYMDWHYQEADKKVELLNKAGIPIWVMEPVRGGSLARLPKAMTKQLEDMRPDESVPAWAFRFSQSIKGVVLTLSGMSNMEQLKDNLATYKERRPLSDDEFNKLLELMDHEVRRGVLTCTSCRYCTQYCPKKLPIPDLIALFTKHKMAAPGFDAAEGLRAMPKEELPGNCIGCRSCEKVCPQQIKISDTLKEFAQEVRI